jgi:hypothetical protein
MPAPTAPLEGPVFTVLCRIDAYADYKAQVAADSPEEAVHLADWHHEEYEWRSVGTTEFDDRLYIALDENGDEIDLSESRI